MEPERLPPAPVMVLSGVILVATFFLPWQLEGGTHFSWHGLRAAHGLQAYWPVVFLAAGIVAIATSRTRLPGFLRTMGCVLAGLGPIVFARLFAAGAIPAAGGLHLGWRLPVAATGLLLCASGFLYRRVHDGALAKLVTTIGAVAFLATLLVPQAGRLPLTAVLDAAMDGEGWRRLMPLAVLVAASLATLTVLLWVPGFVGAWAVLTAWLMLLAAPAALVALGPVGDALLKTPGTTIYPAANVFALSVLASHGLTAMLARITA